MSSIEKQTSRAEDLLREAPKFLTADYLRKLFKALCKEKLQTDTDANAVSNSLVLMILDDATSSMDRFLAIAVLQKLPPISKLSELLTSMPMTQIVNSLPLFFMQGIDFEDISLTAKRLMWSLQNDNLAAEEQKTVLAFLNAVAHFSKNPLDQDSVKKITNLLPNWIVSTISVKKVARPSRLKRSPSLLSITEVDGTEVRDIFTILNFSHVTTAEQFLNIQAFSMLRSWLTGATRTEDETDKGSSSQLSSVVSEELSMTLRDYCLRLIDQTKIKPPSAGIAEYQRACLIEAVMLLDVICCADPGLINIILPTVKQVYKEVSQNVLDHPEAKDVAVVTAVMQFFIHHSSAVMYKHDDLYPFVFCDLLNACYEDNFAAFEIIYLMKENLAQLCYHSSILEKYFPTFFKVLARWPVTYADDFLVLLPAFMTQQTSIEIFHTIIDLPWLSAILFSRSCDPKVMDDIKGAEVPLREIMKRHAYRPILNYTLRKCSSLGSNAERETFCDYLKSWNKILMPLASHPGVLACAETCISLLKCFFSTFQQYADPSVVVLLIPAMLEKVDLIFPVPNYESEVQKIFADSFVQLFGKHPVVIFHCQKTIAEFLSHMKNFTVSTHCFIHLVWAVGEYVSIEYSELCRPEVIIYFFQHIEPTIYEIISSLSWSSDDLFLKLLNVSLSTIAKLAARSQDLVPRAMMCLSKAHKQLTSFDEHHRSSWRIVIERALELLNILKTPNVASVILSPPKDLESGKLHCDATSLPFVLRAVTALLDTKEKSSGEQSV